MYIIYNYYYYVMQLSRRVLKKINIVTRTGLWYYTAIILLYRLLYPPGSRIVYPETSQKMAVCNLHQHNT